MLIPQAPAFFIGWFRSDYSIMPLRLLRLFLVLVAMACVPLHAKDVTSAWFADGKFIEESVSQRMTNGFGGRLDFTDDPDFLNHWRTHWNSISSVKHLERVYIVLFVACNYDSEPQDAVYDITIKKPDGSVCNRFINCPAVKQRASPATGPHDAQPTLRLSPRFTIFQTDPPDPDGIYTVEVELRDQLRHSTLKLTKQLNVVK